MTINVLIAIFFQISIKLEQQFKGHRRLLVLA